MLQGEFCSIFFDSRLSRVCSISFTNVFLVENKKKDYAKTA